MQKRHFMMKNFIGFLLVIILMSSCSEYQKLLKSGDSQVMYKKAVEYYNNGDYTKAFCSYNQKDYEVAAELFKQFVSIYPESSYVEECLYMIGYCNFLASPKARLDQTVTEKAMESFQLYLSRYPNSVVSLENCLKDYPGSKYREEIMYMLFNSKYEMAVNSVEDKQYERYNAAKEEYYYFLDEYPESRYAKEMARKYEIINEFLKPYDVDEEE